MFNLPINTKVANNIAFHQGNHDNRGIPHEQYVSKWNLNTTSNNLANTNKYTKILEVTYEEDNNVGLNYIIEIVNTKDLAKTDYLYMTLGTSKTVKYTYNEYYALYQKITTTMQTNGKNKSVVEIFIQIYKSYSPLFFRVHTAKNNEVYNYDNDYAYNCISLLSNQPFVDTLTGFTQCADVAPIRHFYKRQSWGQVTVNAGQKYQIVISDSNIKWDSILSFNTSVEVPSELMYTVSVASGGGSAIINIRNVSTVSANFPACQLLLMITQSF